MGYDNAKTVGHWANVWPSYIVFHPENESFTRLETPFLPGFRTFYDHVIANMARCDNLRGFATGPKAPHTFDVWFVLTVWILLTYYLSSQEMRPLKS